VSCTLLPAGGMSEPYNSISTELQVRIITRMLIEDTRFLQALESLISVQKTPVSTQNFRRWASQNQSRYSTFTTSTKIQRK